MNTPSPGMRNQRMDIDGFCAVLQRFAESMGTDSESKVMREAALALRFVWGNGHIHNFEDLMSCFDPSAPAGQSASFDSQEQALRWLTHGRDNRRSPCLSVQGVRYSIFYSLDRGEMGLIRVPTLAELTTVHPSTGVFTDKISSALYLVASRAPAPGDKDAVLATLGALYFIAATGQMNDFEDYAGNPNSKVTLAPIRVFDTRQEADSWLKSHPRPPHGGRVEISGQPFSVGYDRPSDFRVLVRQPSLEELGLTGPTDEPSS